MIGIYKITNPNAKVYIGQSVNITKRWSEHKNLKEDNKTKLANSLKKYGIDNHIFEILEICEVSELNTKERYYQDYYNSFEDGLNLILTKSNDWSGHHHKITLEKISEINKKVWEERNPRAYKLTKKDILKERKKRIETPEWGDM